MTCVSNLLPVPLNAAAVRSYINFDGGAEVDLAGSPQACLQSEGVAAIWHLLTTKGYAYLADEVGMGKTRQAMGVIATQFLSAADSHVVIVCPGKTLQAQWSREWTTFIETCVKSKDDRLVSTLDGRALHRPQRHERLRDFAKALLLNESRIHLLRYSSFSRPIWFSANPDGDTVDTVARQFRDSLLEIGIKDFDATETRLLENADARKEDWRERLTASLNQAYARRIGTLLRSRNIDLLTLDEAQYLRHVDNRQNTNLAHVFRGHVGKWHFLSATPLHSSKDDIRSLDTYLCRRPQGFEQGRACKGCEFSPRCTQATHRMQHDGKDVVELLQEFMVRRPRSFKDADGGLHGKIAYRRYHRVAASAASDPFLALTMAAVQKQLVHVLNGQSNRFRQGECSSFESLAASVKRLHPDPDQNPRVDRELDPQGSAGGKVPVETMDRGLINRLNASFFAAMRPGVQRGETPDPQYDLPHAKLTQVCERLVQSSLLHGDLHKTLVFVRRVDTVTEMVSLLLSRFQREVDRRVEAWHGFLSAPPHGLELREDVWPANSFWRSRHRDDDQQPDPEPERKPGETPDPEEGAAQFQRAKSLDYFEAIRRASKKHEQHGMLVSFQSRLLSSMDRPGPFAGFLLKRPDDDSIHPAQWEAAERHWQAFLQLLCSGQATAAPDWLRVPPDTPEAEWKLATLKRCLLQSMRQSDFLVDLYILNRYISVIPGGQAGTTLPEKLLWLLKDGTGLPPALLDYHANWKQRLWRWIEHFDLIVEKCLRKDGNPGWEQISANVDAAFARMAPVVGRSGALPNANAVTQFNFPTHPNILVCTDVLKEGVNLHLFCDEIVHYGVAWTSGDLEQRIGRIDRFGSQISRRLARHAPVSAAQSQPSLPAALPRLNVQFPYLEGTLDRYQVERVMLAKVKSDLRMDLGKHEGEIGHITIVQLEHAPQDHIVVPKAVEQFPLETAHVRHGALGVPGRFVTVPTFPADKAHCTHAPDLDALIIDSQHDAAHPLLCPSEHKTGRKIVTKATRQQYLAPAAMRNPAPAIHLGQALGLGLPLAIGKWCDAGNFRYDSSWNTVVRQVIIPNPFDDRLPRSQTVLLERLHDYVLLRTPIARLDGESSNAPDWPEIAGNVSLRRRWGYMVIDHGLVWFVCFALAPAGHTDGVWLDHLCEHVGKVGDRLQHLHCKGADHEDWHYQATTGIAALAAANAASLHQLKGNFMTTQADNLHAYGTLLSGAQRWLSDAFMSVLDALYGEHAQDRTLHPTDVTLRPDGVLHIAAAGPERFNVEVYLQLLPQDGARQGVAAPRIIWQIGVSTANKGPKPELRLRSWGDLPHNAMEGWTDDPGTQAAVHFSRDNRRYLVLYHHPAKWDSARHALLAAWSGLLGKMNGPNFLQKAARDGFLSALG